MWLDTQEKQVLTDWIRRTKIPVLASKPDGRILWVNPAFEALTGYSYYEIVDKDNPLTWKDITVEEDLLFDERMVEDLEKGVRTDYMMEKRYKHKNGPPVSVIIEVLRYPLAGEFQFCLVTAVPLNHGYEAALIQLKTIKELLVPIAEVCEKNLGGLTVEKVYDFIVNNPKKAAFIALLLAVLLFGKDVLETITSIQRVLTPGVGP